DELTKKSIKDSEEDRKMIEKLRSDWDKENKKYTKENVARKDSERQQGELAKKLESKEAELATANTDKNKKEAQVVELKNERDEMRKRIKEDDKTLADKALDSEALKVLQNWPKDKMRWQISRMDQRGTMPYINLGSADGLEAGVTFSVHSMGRDGKL